MEGKRKEKTRGGEEVGGKMRWKRRGRGEEK